MNHFDIEQPPLTSDDDDQAPQPPIAPIGQPLPAGPTGRRIWSGALLLVLVFALGLAGGYLLWGRLPASQATAQASVQQPTAMTSNEAPATPDSAGISQVAASSPQESDRKVISLPASYALPVAFGDLGPKLVEAGAIDTNRFVQVYQQAGQPLTEEQLKVLTEGSDAQIVMDRSNAYFLLNFFWALGLSNQNKLLDEGPMKQYSKGDIAGFASTGGWTVGKKPATDLYSAVALVTLTPGQQARLEEVAAGVYRPCCNNPTSFPDCNHGIAMLGMLELMASQDASTDEMFEAAKYANAFWFPQQSLEMAAFFKATENRDFAQVNARQLVGPQISSSTGFRQMHQWLVSNGSLDQAPNSGNSCGV